MKKIMLFLVIAMLLFLIPLIIAYPSTELKDSWMDGYTPSNGWHKYYSGDSVDYRSFVQLYTSSLTPSYNVVTGDFDNDGNVEIAFTSGSILYIRNSTMGAKAQKNIGSGGYITVIDDDCDYSGEKVLIVLQSADDIVATYCFNGTTINLKDSESVNARSVIDELVCDFQSTLPICMFASDNGYTYCDIGFSGAGALYCIEYSNSYLTGYSYAQRPALKDLGLGGDDIEAVFYCYNSSSSVQGLMIVDQDGNMMSSCFGNGGTLGCSKYYPIILDNDYIGMEYSDICIPYINGHDYWKFFDKYGTTKYDTYLKCPPVNMGNGMKWGIGMNQKGAYRPVERDSDGDGYVDEFCYWNDQYTVGTSYDGIGCYSEGTGTCTVSISADNQPISCTQIYAEPFGSQLGDEILCNDVGSAYFWYHNSSAPDEFSAYRLNTSWIYRNNVIVTNLFGGSRPDLFFYDTGGITYFNNGTISSALQCSDGTDNDADGYTDYPADFCCSSPSDDTEACQCNNAIDDDSDSYTDYPADVGCADLLDDNETNPSVPPITVNYAPTFIQVNSTYGLINSIGDPNGGFHASANDTEDDTLAWGIDCNYQDWHESSSNDVSTSVYIARKILSESISCTDFIDSEHAKRFKLYLYDDDHKGWGNFSTLYGAYHQSHGTVFWIPYEDIDNHYGFSNRDDYEYVGANVIEGQFLWTNKTPIEYLTVKVRLINTYENINYAKVIVTNYSTIDSPAGTDGMWEITGEHGLGGYYGSYRMGGDKSGDAFFEVPQGTYQVKVVDVVYWNKSNYLEIPKFANVTANCTTSPTIGGDICVIQVSVTTQEGATGNEIHFLVKDSINSTLLEGVNVTLISPEYFKKITNPVGVVNFYNLSYETYEVRFDKDGYFRHQSYYLTGAYGNTVNLVPTTQNPTIISLTVKDNNQIPIKDVFVEMGNPITYETYYAFTGTDGTVIQAVLDGDYNWNFHLTLSGYADKDYTRFINRNVNNEFTLFMSQSGEGVGYNYTFGQCQDMVKGVWLCNQSNLKCTADNQCLGGLCDPAGYCSAFNWTWCDAHGRPRNQRCMLVASGNRGLEKTADWMLSNFFYVLVIIVLLFLVALVLVMLRGRTK